jgi:hypothetical protein
MLYRHLLPEWLYHIFPQYLINGTIFFKMLLEKKCVLIFSGNLSEKFLILIRIHRVTTINIPKSSSERTHYYYQILMKLESSRHIFENLSNIKFHKNPTSGSRDLSIGRTDGQTDVTKLIVAFRIYGTRLNIPHSAHTVYLCVLYGFQNKQQLFPYTALTDWFL